MFPHSSTIGDDGQLPIPAFPPDPPPDPVIVGPGMWETLAAAAGMAAVAGVTLALAWVPV